MGVNMASFAISATTRSTRASYQRSSAATLPLPAPSQRKGICHARAAGRRCSELPSGRRLRPLSPPRPRPPRPRLPRRHQNCRTADRHQQTSGSHGCITAPALSTPSSSYAGIWRPREPHLPHRSLPIQHLKIEHLGNSNPRLHTDEVPPVCLLVHLAPSTTDGRLWPWRHQPLRGSQGAFVRHLSPSTRHVQHLGMNVTFSLSISRTLYRQSEYRILWITL